MHQDVSLYAGRFDAGQVAHHEVEAGLHGWIQIARGIVAVDEERLSAGDGAAVVGCESIEVVARYDAEILVFDLG